VRYIGGDYVLVVTYVFLVTLLFAFGFLLGAQGPIPIRSVRKKNYEILCGAKNTRLFFIYLIIVSLCFTLYGWWVFFTGAGSLSFSSLGSNYIDSYAGYERGQAKINFTYLLNILLYSVVGVVFFFSAFYYQGLSPWFKKSLAFVIFSFLFTQLVASGKQKFLGDFVVCATLAFGFYYARSAKQLSMKAVFGLSSGFFLVGFLFLEILRQRYVAIDIGVYNFSSRAHDLITMNESSLVFDVFGDEYGLAFSIFLSYFSNGLHGLALCLQLPFEWTYFVGNSYSLTRLVEIITDSNGAISAMSYPARAGEVFGWGASKWHSLYSWMASDFTFPGVAAIAFFFGAFYGRLWLEALAAKKFASGPLFAVFSLGLVFSLANNQIMHTLSGIITVLFVFAMWLLSGRGRA